MKRVTDIKRFDKHQWNAKLYIGHADILKVLRTVMDKEIAGIRVIGAAYDVGRLPYPETPFVDIDYGNENQPMPCYFNFEEPVCISFTDGTTIEILPVDIDRWYIGYNSIPEDLIHGLNNSNLDTGKLLNKLIGMKINGVRCMRRETTDLDIDYERQDSIGIKFIFSGWSYSHDPYGFSIEVSLGSFYFAMTRPNMFYTYGNRIASITQEERQEAYIEFDKQVPISEGHGGSSYFAILPVKYTVTQEEYEGEERDYNNVIEYDEEEISIEEDYIDEFLYYFLEKYFNQKLTSVYRNSAFYGTDETREEFERWADYNVYSYSDIRSMLDEMRTVSDLLVSDYDNPALNVIKKYFSYCTFITDEDGFNWDASEEERQRVIKKNIYIAKDFYDRFIRRMEVMMTECPDYEAISFMGP